MPDMQEIDVETIEAGQYFTKPLYLDEDYILLSPETPISPELIARLGKWKFPSVWSEGQPSTSAGSSDTDGASSALAVEDDPETSEIREEVEAVFADLAAFTERLFTNYVSNDSLSHDKITEKIKEVIEALRARRHHMTRITEFGTPGTNYIVMHSVKSTILSLAVGLLMKLPPHKLLELGTSALLHEIGMIRLPSKLYMSDRKLSEPERKAITAHPVLGFRILRSFSFPMPICLGVLESHERIDGKGYPRAISGEKISQYAKIIYVCDSYSAQVSKRPFRDARDGHASLLDMLQERGTAYDEQVLKFLIQLVSVYPVGTYVEIEDGSRGVVVDTEENDPRAPVVKILQNAEGQKGVQLPTLRTNEDGYRVSRALDGAERDELASTES